MKDRIPLIIELSFLLGVLLTIAIYHAPAHCTSIWMDRDFSGWVYPVANRIAAGQVLYADGGHIPLPPLSFVTISMLSGGDANWLFESSMFFGFLVALLMVMYFGLSMYLPRPVPFLTVLAAIPHFMARSKVLFYDSLPQFWTALASVLAVAFVCSDSESSSLTGRRLCLLISTGAVAAADILTKQNTGLGTFAGIILVLTVLPRASGPAGRLKELAVFLLSFAISIGLVLLTLAPWVSASGLVNDIFLTGSLPKGGSALVLSLLVSYFIFVGKLLLMAGLLILILCGLAHLLGWSEHIRRLKDEIISGAKSLQFPSPAAVYLTSFVTVLLLSIPPARLILQAPFAMVSISSSIDLLLAGLVVSIGAAVIVLWKGLAVRDRLIYPLTAFLIVLLPAGFFHSLSTDRFYVCEDNNPLLIVLIAAMMLFAASAINFAAKMAGWSSKARSVLMMIAFMSFLTMMSTHYTSQYYAAAECTQAWTEIKSLKGARMRPEAAGMRELVKKVRSLSGQNETVLLLPSDPNVESWFERPRPGLSTVMLFPDQYWSRYVEQDLQRLSEKPPKVIVIGPEKTWAQFSKRVNQDRGTKRLIDTVKSELIPRYYELAARQEIKMQFTGPDYMDVYVRKD